MFTSTADTIVEQFELYNNDDSSQLNGEIALAAAWKQKVSDLLPENTTILETHKISKATAVFA